MIDPILDLRTSERVEPHVDVCHEGERSTIYIASFKVKDGLKKSKRTDYNTLAFALPRTAVL
jgi:hypothetical protein